MRRRLGFPSRRRQRQTRAWVSVWLLFSVLPVAGCRQQQTVLERVDAPTPTPTPTPVMPKPSPSGQPATAPILPGTSSNVPEMLTRPFTPQELDKALEQLPPEVRQQMRGLGYGLSNKPAPVKPNPSSTTQKPSTSP